MLKSMMIEKLTAAPILVVCAGIMLCPQSQASNAAKEKRMNVLFLVADDLNSWLLGDSNRYARKVIAPNLTKLAESGVLFEDFAPAMKSLR